MKKDDASLKLRDPISATPMESGCRTELEAVVSALSSESLSNTDERLLRGVVAAVRTALDVSFAALSIPGCRLDLGDAETRLDAALQHAGALTRIVVQADEIVQIEEVSRHPAFSSSSSGRHFDWFVGMPIHGYNGLTIGALILVDPRRRSRLDENEVATLRKLAEVIESALQNHRNRVIARAQRALLVKRLRDAGAHFGPAGAAQRRNLHDLKNAITALRLNTQSLEESQKLDPETMADIREALRHAESTVRQIRIEPEKPDVTGRMNWSELCDVQIRRVRDMASAECEIEIRDESERLASVPGPECLGEVADLLVNRALSVIQPGEKLTISVREFRRFGRVSVRVRTTGMKPRREPVVEPLLLHPARTALIAIGGNIVVRHDERWSRWSAWFPLDSSSIFVI